MTPLNQSERKKSFLNFLFFFIVTIAVIVIAVFYSKEVPFKENEKLRREMDVVENERDFLLAFESKMQETSSMLDSVNSSAYSFRIDNNITNNINTMDSMINDSISVKNMCNKIIENLKNLQNTKKDLRKVNNSNEELLKKEERIKDLEQKIETCNSRVIQLLSK